MFVPPMFLFCFNNCARPARGCCVACAHFTRAQNTSLQTKFDRPLLIQIPMGSRGGSKQNYKFVRNPWSTTQSSFLGFVKVSAAFQIVKAIINLLVSEAVLKAVRADFVCARYNT